MSTRHKATALTLVSTLGLGGLAWYEHSESKNSAHPSSAVIGRYALADNETVLIPMPRSEKDTGSFIFRSHRIGKIVRMSVMVGAIGDPIPVVFNNRDEYIASKDQKVLDHAKADGFNPISLVATSGSTYELELPGKEPELIQAETQPDNSVQITISNNLLVPFNS